MLLLCLETAWTIRGWLLFLSVSLMRERHLFEEIRYIPYSGKFSTGAIPFHFRGLICHQEKERGKKESGGELFVINIMMYVRAHYSCCVNETAFYRYWQQAVSSLAGLRGCEWVLFHLLKDHALCICINPATGRHHYYKRHSEVMEAAQGRRHHFFNGGGQALTWSYTYYYNNK